MTKSNSWSFEHPTAFRGDMWLTGFRNSKAWPVKDKTGRRREEEVESAETP